MAGLCKNLRFSCAALAVAALVAALSDAGDALAQSRIDTSISSPGPQAVDARRRSLIRTPQSPVETERRARVVAVPQADETADAADDFDDEEGDEPGLGPRPAAGARRRVPLDGDLRPVAVPQQVDGVLRGETPTRVLDGEDPTREDGRSEEDIDAFENPPAGYDPDAFSIELSPILDRRPGRLFRFEPYEPIGIKMGSFVLFGELDTAVSATNNVFQSPDARSDVAFELVPSVRIVSDWRRHAVEFNASSDLSYHRDHPTQDDRTYRLEARGRLDIRRRTNVEALVSRDVSQEESGTANSLVTSGSERTSIVTDTAAATLNHRFNRLSLQLRGSLVDINYAPTDVDVSADPAAPRFVSVDDRDYLARDLALRASWEFKPELTLFGEAALVDRRYDRLQNGIDRSSSGQRWRAGVSFGNDGAYLRGEFSLGYGFQDPDAVTLARINAFLFDANLAWRFNELTSLLFTASTELDETSIDTASGAVVRSAGITLRHAFRRNLIGEAGLDYSRTTYEGAGIAERALTASLGIEYSLNRNVVVFSDYEHLIFDSSEPASDYNSDEVRVGLRLRR